MSVAHSACSRLSRAGALLAVLLGMLLPELAAADLAGRYEFNIAAQPLREAIEKFTTQSGVQVTVAAELLKDRRAHAVVGTFLAREALERLLAGTNLQQREVDADTVALISSPGITAVLEDGLHVDEVVVTGSRIARAEKEGAQEVWTYTRRQIDRSGQGTLADFLSTLPEVSMMSSDSPNLSFGGLNTVRLHGLPEGTTLVLLNGRRLEINNHGYFDLNNIPLSALERIEVLPVGSSAIYGADSLAGAVNLILKQDLDGGEFAGDGAEPC